MKIIYRYIFLELITPILFGIAAFTGIFIGTDLLFRLIDYYNSFNVHLLTLVQLFFLNLPAIMVLTFPMATLLGTILAFGRLSNDNEVTAFRAGGISMLKLAVPALITGLLMTVLTIAVNELVVPAANYLDEQIIYQLRYGKSLPATQTNLVLPRMDGGKPDFILYTSLFDGETGKMQDVSFQDYQEGKPVYLLQAEEAIWKEEGWYFFDGEIFYLKPGERIPQLKFKEYLVQDLSYTPQQISSQQKKIDDMSMKELQEYISLKNKQGNPAYKERVKLHQRISIPFASFIFTLLAIPLAIQPRRSAGSATGMGMSIIIIFIYYSIMTIGSALGEQGVISPVLGAWIQNLVFLVLGGILMYRKVLK